MLMYCLPFVLSVFVGLSGIPRWGLAPRCSVAKGAFTGPLNSLGLWSSASPPLAARPDGHFPTGISGFGHWHSWPPWASRPWPSRGLLGFVVVCLLGVVGGRCCCRSGVFVGFLVGFGALPRRGANERRGGRRGRNRRRSDPTRGVPAAALLSASQSPFVWYSP